MFSSLLWNVPPSDAVPESEAHGSLDPALGLPPSDAAQGLTLGPPSETADLGITRHMRLWPPSDADLVLKLEPTSDTDPRLECHGSLDAALGLKLWPSSDAASRLGFGSLTDAALALELQWPPDSARDLKLEPISDFFLYSECLVF